MNTREMLKSIQENSHQMIHPNTYALTQSSTVPFNDFVGTHNVASENVEMLIQQCNELKEENDYLKEVLRNFAFWFNKTYPDPNGNSRHPHSVAMRVLGNYDQQTKQVIK